MGSQIAGYTSANIAEVEANTKALRATLRPEDYGSLGFYSLGAVSGTMAAGLAGSSIIFAFRYGGANLALVKRVLFSAAVAGTGFSTGAASFALYAARGFTANDTGGTAVTPTANGNKLRTSGMATTGVSDIRISSTAALGAGTRTLDAQPIGLVSGGAAGAGSVIIPANTVLVDQRPGEHPLVLAQNEGFEIYANVPATGTWIFAVKVDWGELASY